MRKRLESWRLRQYASADKPVAAWGSVMGGIESRWQTTIDGFTDFEVMTRRVPLNAWR
jgi:hypothetical protein